jgi:hypothetical protein
MLRQTLNFCLALGLAASTQTLAQSASAQFKQLAGPAGEISEMRLPAPETLGQRSKAAMLPIRKTGGDNTWRREIPVDNAGDLKIMLLAPRSEAWDLRLAQPKEEFLNLRRDAAARNIARELTAVTFDGDFFPAEVYTFEKGETGLWRLEIELPQGVADGKVLGYVVVSAPTPYQLYSFVNTNRTVTGQEIGLVSRLFNHDVDGDTGLPRTLPGLARAEFTLQSPKGEASNVAMFDDGAHGDGAAGDGVFGGSFRPMTAGRHVAQVTARGVTPEGQEFIRTSEHLIEVAGNGVVLGDAAIVSMVDDVRWRISLPLRGIGEGRKLIGYGEIWARGADAARPVAWISGLTLTERNGKRGAISAGLTLDTRWLALGESAEAYELRNVRFQDPDYFTVLGEASTVSLPNLPAQKASRTIVRQINDEMRMGVNPRPANLNAPGGKLMLIHGYCSGNNPWPTSQFSNFVVFNDLNQNRTHDQFANLIRNFGASLPSFGAAAHSQGGAASLHLYTYYFSGLDNATGTRLIQSVGTPYQGTALAGNLALLGQIFGAGCGSNSNLTYSGAASWLAGIPSWARSKVHYSTTSFTDVWWRYDYCNLATDLFLSDPEDGVVEQSKGQLPGANNRGHKTGWCHTSGMRDPAQTSDSARNADINANAAR